MSAFYEIRVCVIPIEAGDQSGSGVGDDIDKRSPGSLSSGMSGSSSESEEGSSSASDASKDSVGRRGSREVRCSKSLEAKADAPSDTPQVCSC